MNRFASIDVARGLIMMIMAIDHCTGAWVANKGQGEFGFPAGQTFSYHSAAFQFSREITHICAPGFQFLAGLGMAISAHRRRLAGQSQLAISLEMVLRGLTLFFCEWVLMHYAFGRSMFFFLVLCCIGSATILFSVLRFLPRWAILFFGVAALLAAPWYGPTEIVAGNGANYLVNLWTRVAFGNNGWFSVLYPVFPWVGFFALGWFLGLAYARDEAPTSAALIAVAGWLMVGGIAVKWFGGNYGDRFAGGGWGPATAAFWLMAKYPPSPFFSLTTLAAILALLGSLRFLDASDPSGFFWRVPQVFGRVALFFYVVHFYLYGLIPQLSGTSGRHSLGVGYAAWAVGLMVLWPICLWYDRMRSRSRGVLRYF